MAGTTEERDRRFPNGAAEMSQFRHSEKNLTRLLPLDVLKSESGRFLETCLRVQSLPESCVQPIMSRINCLFPFA